MGKMSQKRQEKRDLYLRQLAEKSEPRFSREWSKRLPSFAIKAAQNACRLEQEGGKRILAFDVIEEAQAELNRIGLRAVELEASNTTTILENCAAQFVSRAMDHRLHRLVRVNGKR